jgi:hypothetical protein
MRQFSNSGLSLALGSVASGLVTVLLVIGQVGEGGAFQLSQSNYAIANQGNPSSGATSSQTVSSQSNADADVSNPDGSQHGLEQFAVQEYVWLMQVAAVAHDASEWLAYGNSALSWLTPAPTKEDLQQQGAVFDTWELEFAESYAAKVAAGGPRQSTSGFYRPPAIQHSSTADKAPKVDLDPEYTVLSSRSQRQDLLAADHRYALTAPERKGDAAGWTYTPVEPSNSNGNVPSLALGILLTLGGLTILKQGLQWLLAHR